MIRRGGSLVAFALMLTGCGGGGDSAATDVVTAQDGDTVGVFYRGTLDDGSEFDSNEGGSPLVFVVGSGQVIAGFDDAVRDRSVGDTFTVRIEPEDAYGLPDDELIYDLPSEGAPEGLEAGQQVMLSNGAVVTIVAIGEDTITVDANHRLAGEALTFEITVDSIERPEE